MPLLSFPLSCTALLGTGALVGVGRSLLTSVTILLFTLIVVMIDRSNKNLVKFPVVGLLNFKLHLAPLLLLV